MKEMLYPRFFSFVLITFLILCGAYLHAVELPIFSPMLVKSPSQLYPDVSCFDTVHFFQNEEQALLCCVRSYVEGNRVNTDITVHKKFHIGVYGIILKDAAILLVKKSRGPYTGLLDLPGGKPEHGESPQQALMREILEETGITAQESKLYDNYSTVAEQLIDGSTQEKTHHLGMIYVVLAYDDSTLIQEMNAEDSLGAEWYQLKDLTADMLSPFAGRIVENLKQLL